MKLRTALLLLLGHSLCSAEHQHHLTFSHRNQPTVCGLSTPALAFAVTQGSTSIRRRQSCCKGGNKLSSAVLQKDSHRSDATRLHLFPLRSSSAIAKRKKEITSNFKSTDKDLPEYPDDTSRTKKISQRIKKLAKNVVVRPMPLAIVTLLRDATKGAFDIAVDEVLSKRAKSSSREGTPPEIASLVDEAFAPMETSLKEMEEALANARISMEEAKAQATQAIEAVQAAAIAQAEGAATAVARAEEVVMERVMADIYADRTDEEKISTLTYDEVGYNECYMSPPFLDEEQCLIPGEAIVRVEKAPDNSRRIFAGIDIPVGVDDVWSVLTDYENLQKVVPNLVTNNVMQLYHGTPEVKVPSNLSDEEQAEIMAKQMKGALLKQVGGAKVVGINFSARTTLEVREWPKGLPDFAHFEDDVWEGKSRNVRASDNTKVKLQRYRFPRPFALSSLPTRDISMQSIENDDGEFRLYQGVWRMQPLPGCAPKGQQAMRLTYAVEVSPRPYLPVSLVEGRIVKDLCANLVAIREFMTEDTETIGSI